MQHNDINNFSKILKDGNIDDGTISDAVEKMTENQKNKLFELMNNKDLLQKFMESSDVKKIAEKLKGSE